MEQLERVCSVRPAGVILREKDLTEAQYQTLAEKVLALCRRYDVPCILHGFPEAARRLGVQSVQLPLWQLEAAGGKPGLVAFGQIGASVHSVQDALRAEALGADSVTAGHIYETSCKEGLPPRGTEFLRAVCSAVRIPVYAIAAPSGGKSDQSGARLRRGRRLHHVGDDDAVKAAPCLRQRAAHNKVL